MKNLVGALMYAQSGGPTSVINSSAAGVFLEGLKQENVTAVYGASHGIRGVLEEDFYDISKEDENELLLLKNTPSSSIGSVRYKLKDYKVDDTDYKRILEIFKKYNIRYFLYNGGNDSMDTCNKISKYIKKSGWDCNVIGVPKTIDNDLYGTDHCPGFASASKYIATTVMEIKADAIIYPTPLVFIVETMGRHAGWLTASSVLSSVNGYGPDLIYMPEVAFSIDKFINDIQNVLKKNNNKCLVVVSEGVKDENGNFIGEVLGNKGAKDNFGHTQLGGVGSLLANLVKERTGVKTKFAELNIMQRCSAHIASKVDVEEAFKAGAYAVKGAVRGITDKMVIFDRTKANGKYKCKYKFGKLSLAANNEKTVPTNWIINDNTYISHEFIDYALPLIQGENKIQLENGLPRFAKLKKITVAKK